MKRFQRIFLCVGIVIVAVSIAIISTAVVETTKKSYEYVLENDVYKNMGEFWIWCFLGNIFVKGPIILSEILLIRNGYIFLVNGQTKFKKFLCLISSIFAIISLVLLYISNNGNYMYHVQQNYITISWLILIISFVIGTIRGRLA